MKAVASNPAANEFTNKAKAADYLKEQMVKRNKKISLIYNAGTFPSGLGLSLIHICVNNEVLHPHIATKEDHGKIKLLMVLVKNYSLHAAIEDIKTVIDEDTIILSLLNGVTAVDALQEAFPNNKVLYGIVMRTDANRTDDNITFKTLGEIQFGEEENIHFSEDVKTVINILEANHINYHVYEDMKRMLWRKWMVNIGANQISLLTSAKFKYFGEFKEIQIALDLSLIHI